MSRRKAKSQRDARSQAAHAENVLACIDEIAATPNFAGGRVDSDTVHEFIDAITESVGWDRFHPAAIRRMFATLIGGAPHEAILALSAVADKNIALCREVRAIESIAGSLEKLGVPGEQARDTAERCIEVATGRTPSQLALAGAERAAVH